MVVGGLVRILRRLRGVMAEPRLVQAAVRKLGRRRRHPRVVRVMMAVGIKMSGVPPDVVPVSVQEAELRVVEDVEVGAAQAVAGRADQQVPVVLPALPPDGEVEGRPAQLEAGRQERVAQNLQVNGKLYRTASTTEAQN